LPAQAGAVAFKKALKVLLLAGRVNPPLAGNGCQVFVS